MLEHPPSPTHTHTSRAILYIRPFKTWNQLDASPHKAPLCLLTARRWAYLCGPAFTPFSAMSGFCDSSPLLCHSHFLLFYRSRTCLEGLGHTLWVSLDMKELSTVEWFRKYRSKWKTRPGWGGRGGVKLRPGCLEEHPNRQAEKGHLPPTARANVVFFG